MVSPDDGTRSLSSLCRSAACASGLGLSSLSVRLVRQQKVAGQRWRGIRCGKVPRLCRPVRPRPVCVMGHCLVLLATERSCVVSPSSNQPREKHNRTKRSAQAALIPGIADHRVGTRRGDEGPFSQRLAARRQASKRGQAKAATPERLTWRGAPQGHWVWFDLRWNCQPPRKPRSERRRGECRDPSLLASKPWVVRTMLGRCIGVERTTFGIDPAKNVITNKS